MQNRHKRHDQVWYMLFLSKWDQYVEYSFSPPPVVAWFRDSMVSRSVKPALEADGPWRFGKHRSQEKQRGDFSPGDGDDIT